MSEYCVTNTINDPLDYRDIIKSPQEIYDDNNKTSSEQLKTLVSYMKNVAVKDKFVLNNNAKLGNKYFFDTGLTCKNDEYLNKPVYKVINNIPTKGKGLIGGIIDDFNQIKPQNLTKSIFNTNNIKCEKIENVKCYNGDGKETNTRDIYIDEIDEISKEYAKEKEIDEEILRLFSGPTVTVNNSMNTPFNQIRSHAVKNTPSRKIINHLLNNNETFNNINDKSDDIIMNIYLLILIIFLYIIVFKLTISKK
tara:strand:- start:10 stop:762 length:753 start_codon:yes stop_codon:yes gene_type:complete